MIDSVEEEKAENLAGKLMQFAENSGVDFKQNVDDDIKKYIDGDQSEGLKTKLANYIGLDSCTFKRVMFLLRRPEACIFLMKSSMI